MKVYLVMKGAYSDRHVDSVFSTEEAADIYVEMQSRLVDEYEFDRDSWSVSECEVDAEVGLVVRERTCVSILLSDGSVDGEVLVDRVLVRPGERGEAQVHENRWGPVTVVAWSYESKEHALKLAVEARQAWLRDKTLKGVE